MIKQKYNGFTLIELLAVIVILAIIALIAIPQIQNIVEKSKEEAYARSVDAILKASENYLFKNRDIIPSSVGDTAQIKLSDLVNSGLVTKLSNPKDDSQECAGYILVTKVAKGQFNYEPYINCDSGNDSYANDNLIGHWKFDKNTNDYTPNNYDCTVNGVTYTEDRFGNSNSAVYFDNDVDHLNCGNIGTLDEYTATVWIKPSVLVGTGENVTYGFTIMSVSANASTYGIWLLYTNKEIRLFAYAPTASVSNAKLTSGANVDINEWNQIAVSAKRGGTAKIYVNGKLISTFAASSTVWNGVLTIGDLRPNRAIGYRGSIDDIKMYSRILSDDEIKYNYNLEK